MDCDIVFRSARAALRAGAVTLLLSAVAASGANAQTLADPAPPAKRAPPPKAEKTDKSPHAARVKSCSGFGPGFVNVPGTDACVKIGGWVTVEGSAQH